MLFPATSGSPVPFNVKKKTQIGFMPRRQAEISLSQEVFQCKRYRFRNNRIIQVNSSKISFNFLKLYFKRNMKVVAWKFFFIWPYNKFFTDTNIFYSVYTFRQWPWIGNLKILIAISTILMQSESWAINCVNGVTLIYSCDPWNEI